MHAGCVCWTLELKQIADIQAELFTINKIT